MMWSMSKLFVSAMGDHIVFLDVLKCSNIEGNGCWSLSLQSLIGASFNHRIVPQHSMRKYSSASRLSGGSRNMEPMNDAAGLMDAHMGPDEYGNSMRSQFYERRRSLLSPFQISRLNKAFLQSQYLTSEMKNQLATELQLSASVVRVWIINLAFFFMFGPTFNISSVCGTWVAIFRSRTIWQPLLANL